MFKADDRRFRLHSSRLWGQTSGTPIRGPLSTRLPVARYNFIAITALRVLSPSSIKSPFARYSHGIAVPAGHRLVFTSGQLGISADERQRLVDDGVIG